MTGPSETSAGPGEVTLSPGERVDHFEIRRTLGRGGMGIVFRVKEKSTGDTLALKILKTDEMTEETSWRFDRECRVIAKLSHENIVGT